MQRAQTDRNLHMLTEEDNISDEDEKVINNFSLLGLKIRSDISNLFYILLHL